MQAREAGTMPGEVPSSTQALGGGGSAGVGEVGDAGVLDISGFAQSQWDLLGIETQA